MRKTRIIFRKAIAEQLQLRGHFVIKTLPNYRKPGFVVYVFNITELFEKDLAGLITKFKKI